MNRKFLILAILLILIGILLAGFLVYKYITPAPQPPGSQNQITFPSSGTGTGNIPPGPSTAQMPVGTQSGNTIQVKDFIHNGETISDVENTGSYLLAGSLGYCLPNIKCTAATSTNFNIGFDSKAQAFTIALLKEPIGNARHEAEQFLISRLGIPAEELCSLNYYVGTTYFVNESYDSGNLGFSFCPGATKLP
ncbi:hypothetical protein H0X32_03880 [Patescibacteria group bacterium]|nr:hypothetical protein [Patescibacteria group bacterium]